MNPSAQYVAVEWCTVQYQRADNMWAPFGKPDGNLGIETIQVQANGKQDFNTDWAFERMRNDGVRGWYGSHLRVAKNTGTRQVELWIKNQFRAWCIANSRGGGPREPESCTTATEDRMPSLYPHRMFVVLSGLALAAPATGKPAAHPTASNLPWCEVEYQRADNMWAADGNLGTETVTVSPGWKRWFITDWKYEKFRNDGVRFYGSHLRVAKNTGTMNVGLSIKNQFGSKLVPMQPGQTQQFRDDLEYVFCDGTVNREP